MAQNLWKIDEEALNNHIYKEFNKTKDDLNECIDIMREWSKTQVHFPEEPSDIILRYVVLYNKFSIEKAKQKLDMYYAIRTFMPEFYKSVPLSSEMLLQSRVVYCVVLPKVTPDFKRIIYSQINPNFGPEFFNHTRTIENFCNFVELIIQEDKCYNFHYIFDCAGMQIGHITKFNPMNLRKAAIILEKVYSNRISSFYMVNFAKFMETLLNNVVKPTLNPKIRDRLEVHSSADILLDVFGKSVMPKDIGGEEKSLDELTDLVLKTYEKRKQRFDVLRTLRVDESLRPQKLINDDILGYYGNFKKINVD